MRLILAALIIVTATIYTAVNAAPALAQGPDTNLCVSGVYSDTTWDFTGSTMPVDASISSLSDWNELYYVFDQTYGTQPLSNCGPLVSQFVSGSYILDSDCRFNGENGYDTIGFFIDGPISSPISGTLTTISHVSNTDLRMYCERNGTWDYLDYDSSTTIPAGWTCDRLHYQVARAVGPRWTESASVTCGVGQYPSTPCDLVPNADFTDSSAWLLAGSAAITNSNLTLSPSDSAAQNLTGLTSQTTYDVTLDVSQAVSSTTLAVALGNYTNTLNITSPGIYTTQLAINLGGSLSFEIENTGSGNVDIDFACVAPQSTSGSCSTINDASFDDSSEWNGDGGGANDPIFTNGAVRLDQMDYIYQSVSVDPLATYQASIVVSNFSEEISEQTPAQVALVLGSDYEILEVTDFGTYTATLTADDVSNTTYTIDYVSEFGSVEIDYTCLYKISTGGGQEQLACIAPTNGDFDASGGWDFFRGAIWSTPANEAELPYAEQGLIKTTSAFSLPTLATGENLLMSFNARGSDDAGIAARVNGSSAEVLFSSEIYAQEYTFEVDISDVPNFGDTTADIAFANPGEVGQNGVFSSADIRVDDICIFVATRGPNYPTPTNPNAYPPTDLGFNFSSCADVDAIWAWFGVNMAQHRANYNAGFSFWDPTEWLVSAIFVVLGDWSCLFMAALAVVINTLEHLINNIMNIAHWIYNSAQSGINWIDDLATWLWETVKNVVGEYFSQFSAWADVFWQSLTNTVGAYFGYLSDLAGYLWQSLKNVAEAVISSLSAFMAWLWGSIKSAIGAIIEFLKLAVEWLWESLKNIISWLADTIVAVLNWLSAYLFNFNGIRTIINWLISGWNSFITSLGDLISLLINGLIAFWNDYIYPFLQSIWDFVSTIPLIGWLISLLFGLILSLFNLLWSIVMWIYENVVQIIGVPYELYTGFDSGLQSNAFSGVFTCSSDNFLCYLFAGVQVINQTVGPEILYPVVIVGIIMVTLVVVRDYIEGFVVFILDTLREIN